MGFHGIPVPPWLGFSGRNICLVSGKTCKEWNSLSIKYTGLHDEDKKASGCLSRECTLTRVPFDCGHGTILRRCRIRALFLGQDQRNQLTVIDDHHNEGL